MSTERNAYGVVARAAGEFLVQRAIDPIPGAHHDLHARITHQLQEDDAEVASRAIVRIVPLFYGVAVGALIGHLHVGLAVGVVLSMVADYHMRDKSMVRPLVRGVVRHGVPAIAAGIRKFVGAICRIGRHTSFA